MIQITRKLLITLTILYTIIIRIRRIALTILLLRTIIIIVINIFIQFSHTFFLLIRRIITPSSILIIPFTILIIIRQRNFILTQPIFLVLNTIARINIPLRLSINLIIYITRRSLHIIRLTHMTIDLIHILVQLMGGIFRPILVNIEPWLLRLLL